MPIFTEERCTHCHKTADVALDTMPYPLSKFTFTCPQCGKSSVVRFTYYRPYASPDKFVQGYPLASRLAVSPATC